MTIENRILSFISAYPGCKRLYITENLTSKEGEHLLITEALDRLVRQKKLVELVVTCPFDYAEVKSSIDWELYFPARTTIKLS